MFFISSVMCKVLAKISPILLSVTENKKVLLLLQDVSDKTATVDS